MTDSNQIFIPLLERTGLREAPERELWLQVPEQEADLLREWCWDALESCFSSLYRMEQDYDAFLRLPAGYRLARSLNIDLPQACSIDYGEHWVREAEPNPVALILSAADGDPDFLLNIADYLIVSGLASDEKTEELRGFLNASHSAWQVEHDGSGLALRVPLEQEESFRQAISVEDSTSEYLAKAWDAAWRLNDPNIDGSYRNSVKAIESALKPIVSPDNGVTTLGTITRDIDEKPEKWDTRFRGAETVQALRDLLYELWKTDSRHAGMPPNTLEQAQDAVTIAVAVVALTRRGFLERVDDS